MRPSLTPSSQEYQEWDLPGLWGTGHVQSNSGSDVTKPRNPAFSPAVNIQFFEPPLKCHGPKPLIMASACLWTLSKLSMSFLCLDPDLAQSGFQMELNLDCAERAWSAPAQTINLGICSSACHRLLFFFYFFKPPGIWSVAIFRQGCGRARKIPLQGHVLPWIFTS